jgi:hypothetical protein
MNTDWKGSSQTISVCRWHDLIPKRPEKLQQKTARYHKQLQYSKKIQNLFRKISSLSIYQQWTDWVIIQEHISIYNSLRKIKYLEINLTKEVKDLYKKNYKPLKKEITEDYKRWKDLPCLWISKSILWKWYATKKTLQVQCNSSQNSSNIHHRDWKIQKLIRKYKRPQKVKAILNKRAMLEVSQKPTSNNITET